MSEGISNDIYGPVIAELKAQIEECERTILVLELMRSKAGFTAPVASSASVPAQQNGSTYFANDAFFGMTIADAAKKYLGLAATTANSFRPR